jgi:hypothetical protein
LTGDEPVGRPKTKGCSGVGAKALILSDGVLTGAAAGGVEGPTDDVFGDVS